jgi:putative ABC transport system substrate-binding protein
MQFEYNLSGKWLELLKQIAPGVTRVAVLRDPTVTAGIGQFAVIQSVAPSLGVEVTPIDTNNSTAIEHAVSDFAREPNGGLVATASASGFTQRELTISLAVRYKLPAVYFNRAAVLEGGLISYGADFTDMYRRAASYDPSACARLAALRTPVSRTGRIHFRVNTRPVRMCFRSKRRFARDSFQRLSH